MTASLMLQDTDPLGNRDTLELRVLGPMMAVSGGRELSLGPPRHRALLGLLLIRLGYVVPAGQLIDELWSGYAPRHPIATLQTYISHLRRVLSAGTGSHRLPGLVRYRASGYTLTLDPGAVDAYRFEHLVDQGRERIAVRDFRAAHDLFTRAQALWRGDPYLDLIDYAPLAQENSRLEHLRLTAVENQAESALALGDVDDVVRTLEQETRRYPTRERLVGHLMTGLYRLGRQADALRLYDRTRARLGDELGVDPGVDLQRVHAAILRQELASEPIPADSGAATHVGIESSSPSGVVPDTVDGPQQRGAESCSFVGRDRELSFLRSLTLDATHGGGRLIALVGEAGIGKTELLLRLASSLEDAGIKVIFGHCWSGDGVPPYWVWRDVLGQLSIVRPEAFRAATARYGDLLEPLFSGLEPGAPADQSAPGGVHARFLTHDAVCGTLLAAIGKDPLVIALDNLHQADGPSLDLLKLFVSRTHDRPLSIVVTARDTGGAAKSPSSGILSGILSDSRTRMLRLGGLSEQAIGTLIAARAADGTGPATARDLFERSGGNPHVLAQLLPVLDNIK